MGYYTDYELDVEGLTLEESEEANLRLESISQYGFDGNWVLYSSKWYDHDKDMLKLSKEYPKALFTLTGQGEELGDYWRKYYKNGKFHQATQTFSPFNEQFLK